ncbi:TPR end-of-group domain-containing protein [Ekhidna sp.]|uniref:TPR end-of-group domain-containing protein n=1 Tax=Ekhidna sp. TaxID=2608089 RepID=UPI003C7E304B
MKNVIYSLLILSAFASSSQSLRELYQEGLKAYDEKNYELFTEKMFTIDTMRPNYPAVVYNLAGGYALTGQSSKALKTLEKYILMDATQDFSEDADFTSLLELERFTALKKKQSELTETIELKRTYELSILSSHPESITYSEKQKSFYIGGVRDGSIWEMKEGREPKLWAESPKNSWSVMGLQVSADEKTLWACTSSMNNYQDYNQSEEGFASVLKYDLKNGKLLETYALPGGHNFGDLITDKSGNIYVSDGTANKLYWISDKKGELEELADLSNDIFNLQGLTLDDTEKNLYLSDYIEGIYRFNLKSKDLEKLKIKGDDILIKGIDGLYFTDNSLIGLHNGTNPNRVIKYKLSEDRNAIIGKEVLAQGGVLGEPTQGVWIDGSLHFIMNSPWGAYDQDGNFNPESKSVNIGVIE